MTQPIAPRENKIKADLISGRGDLSAKAEQQRKRFRKILKEKLKNNCLRLSTL